MKSIATLTLIAGLLVAASTFTLSTPAQAYHHNWARYERNVQRQEAMQARCAYNNAAYANPYYNYAPQYYANPNPYGLSLWQRMHAL